MTSYTVTILESVGPYEGLQKPVKGRTVITPEALVVRRASFNAPLTAPVRGSDFTASAIVGTQTAAGLGPGLITAGQPLFQGDPAINAIQLPNRVGNAGSVLSSDGHILMWKPAGGLTKGSVPYVDSGGFIAEDNSNLSWDPVNKRLQIGPNVATEPLRVSSSASGQNTVLRLQQGFVNVGDFLALVMGDTTPYIRIKAVVEGAGQVGLAFDTAQTSERMRITNAGKVGIGTTSPGYVFDVVGAGRFSASVVTPIVQPNTDSTTALQLQTASGTNIVNLDTTNLRVGIGTVAPIQKAHLSVSSTVTDPVVTGTTALYLANTNTSVAAGNGIEFGQSDTLARNVAIYSLKDAAGAGQAAALLLATHTGSAFTEKMRVTSAGNVGIGTATPGAQLNATSGVEIFQTAALTAGSVGSLIAPYDTAATETDAKGGNLNGAFVVNNADLKIYARTGGSWKGTALAGFSIPNYTWKNVSKNPKQKRFVRDKKGKDETICPLCHKQMKPGDSLGMYADKWYNGKDCKEGLHAVACHLKCAMREAN